VAAFFSTITLGTATQYCGVGAGSVPNAEYMEGKHLRDGKAQAVGLLGTFNDTEGNGTYVEGHAPFQYFPSFGSATAGHRDYSH
jgi:hypothetical protein